jgi:hypothetical protein
LFPSQTPSVKASLHYIVFSKKKKKMGVVNNIRALMIVVSMAVCLTSDANAAQGTATFYTPPYVREYLYVPNIIYHKLN